MRKFSSLSILLVASFMVVFTVMSAQTRTADAVVWQTSVDPWILETADSLGETEFLVFLSEQADLSAANSLSTKIDKGNYVYETLTATAARTQPAVIAELEALGVEYHPFWIANMILVKGDMAVIEAMARRDDVSHLYANPEVKAVVPTPEETIREMEAIEWNILMVNADDLWGEGFTGQGAVIGGQDTGSASNGRAIAAWVVSSTPWRWHARSRPRASDARASRGSDLARSASRAVRCSATGRPCDSAAA
jgi:hypothetical protein